MAEPIKMPFGLWTRVGPSKHVLGIDGVHTGTTWRIPLNRPSVAAMRLFVKLLRPLIIRLHRSPIRTWMRPIVTDRVVWSVTLVSPAKRMNRSRCRLG